MKIKENLLKTSENPGKIRKTHWKANARKKHEWTIKTIKGKPKKSLKNRWKPTKTNMNTKKQHKKNQWKPMNKTMISKEQHMKIIENQRKIYEHIKEKQMKTTEKPMKNQRRNNEKPWKTQRQFCQHSKLLFWQVLLAPVLLSFPSSMGKEIRDNFERKRKPLSYFYVCCFLGNLWRKTRCTGRT